MHSIKVARLKYDLRIVQENSSKNTQKERGIPHEQMFRSPGCAS